MNLKSSFLKVFESMVVAWVWLFCLVVNILLLGGSEPQNWFVRIFDKLVMISCFLVYPFASEKEKSVLPFLYQFLFWWIFGAIMIALYRFLSSKKQVS